MSARVLIVNADDFGRSPGVNAGVIRAHEEGILTSATLMVRWPAAEEAAAYARRTPSLSTGLHLDLGEWAFRDGEWHPVYEVLADPAPEAAEAEVARQLSRFEQLVGRPPTHLDSHQHVHRDEPARTALLTAGARLGVPVREAGPVAYVGCFYGQGPRGEPLPEAVGVEALTRLIERLHAGVTELGCHPAAADDHPTAYGSERLRELETLCDPRIRAAIRSGGVELRSFAEVT